MSVTVLLCVHSPGERWDALLARALASLRHQTWREFQTVVVLDQCVATTAEVVAREAPPGTCCLMKPTPKAGLAAAKNYGLQFCDTPWIAFLDADDQYLPTKLERQLEYAKLAPEISVWGTGTVCRNAPRGHARAMQMNGTFTEPAAIARQLPHRNVLTHGSVMMRREVLTALQGYRHVQGAEDWDLWKRALAAGYKFAQVPEPLYEWSYGESVPR